jgi:uncharacterized membrane protein YbhN (UPF0104 family)
VTLLGRRLGRVAATLAVGGLCVAYIVWKIDIGTTAHVIADARLPYFAGAVGVTIVAIFPLAWRWQRLLAARDVDDSLGWLTRTYFVSYAAAQVLPTSLGGDAARIFDGTRRHPRASGTMAGSVLLERALGGAATLTLALVGFALAVGRYDVGPYVWIELGFVVGAVALGVVLFASRMRPLLAAVVPPLEKVRLARPLRAAYIGIHAYRAHPRLLGSMSVLTIVVQAFRVLGIWLVGKSVGVELSPRPYYVMGPMLFLVMLVPFTINGVAVREAFFVNFLGQLKVGANQAFATGFLFFVLSVATAVPGAIILLWEAIRRIRQPLAAPSGGPVARDHAPQP